MKRKILSVLSVLMAVLMSTAALSACNKAHAGADSSGGSGESVSAEQGGEPSVSESADESEHSEQSQNEAGAQSKSSAESSNSDGLCVTITAHTNFELSNGGLAPQVIFVLPNDAIIEGNDDDEKVILSDGSILYIGWTFLYEKKEYGVDNPLYYYENPEKSFGYLSHESVRCGEYDCLRIIEIAPSGKNDPESDAYWYQYFVDLNNGEIFSLDFLVPQSLGDKAIPLQEEIVAAIER